MKKFSIYILGVISGMGLALFLTTNDSSDKYDNPYNIRGLSMLPQKGNCITSSNIEIFQTLTQGIALAHPMGNYNRLFLLLDNEKKLFYDGEKIKMPTKKCAKQIGTYTYETKSEIQKTVPAVIIE